MKKSAMFMIAALFIAAGMVVNAFIMNNDVKTFLLIFFAVGSGLGLLRLFVNSSIKKMKGKGWKTKTLFFSVLLGLGLPFQNWFRKEILLGMDPSHLASSITIMVTGVIFMTAFFNYASSRKTAKITTE